MTMSTFHDLAPFFMNFTDSLTAALLGQNHSPTMHCSLVNTGGVTALRRA